MGALVKHTTKFALSIFRFLDRQEYYRIDIVLGKELLQKSFTCRTGWQRWDRDKMLLFKAAKQKIRWELQKVLIIFSSRGHFENFAGSLPWWNECICCRYNWPNNSNGKLLHVKVARSLIMQICCTALWQWTPAYKLGLSQSCRIKRGKFQCLSPCNSYINLPSFNIFIRFAEQAHTVNLNERPVHSKIPGCLVWPTLCTFSWLPSWPDWVLTPQILKEGRSFIVTHRCIAFLPPKKSFWTSSLCATNES